MVFNIEQFVADRNEALFSFDWRKIVVYSVKYDIDLPEDPRVFWGSIARPSLKSQTPRRRPRSRRRRFWTSWE